MPSRRARAFLPKPEPISISTIQARQRLTPAQQKQRGRGVPVNAWVQPRNGLPDAPFYQYRARRYPHAVQAIQRAEQVHGRPGNEAT